MRWLMTSPRPIPFVLIRSSPFYMQLNNLDNLAFSCVFMPIPLSFTETCNFLRLLIRAACTVTLPYDGVNLSAFETRLMMTYNSLFWSVLIM